MPHVKHFWGKKENEIVDKTLGDVWRVWLNSSPSATSQQMMDTWTGMLDRLWGETGRRSNFEYIIHLFLSVWQRPIHFTCGSQQHLFETAPCRVTSRSETTRTKDDGHLKQTRLDYIGRALFFFFSQRCRSKWETSCCIFAVVTVYCPYGWRHHFNILEKNGNNRMKVNYWPKLLLSSLIWRQRMQLGRTNMIRVKIATWLRGSDFYVNETTSFS